MSDTPLIGLPLLEASQAQKHVTHNEALLLLDALVHLAVISRALAAPPALPADGDRYLVAASAMGEWLGHSGHIAFREAGTWRFAVPKAGWRLWVLSEQLFLLFNGSLWLDLRDFDELQNMNLLGVNTTADAANKLAVASANVLFTHAGSDARLKLNKNTAGDTASLLFQSGFSGRAEFGLSGDDDFHVKVSGDGAAWNESFTVNRTSGLFTVRQTLLLDPQGAHAPLKFQGGANLATPEAGAIEFDGTCFYGTGDAGNRGVIPLEHFIILDADYALANSAAEQKAFNATANGALALDAGLYAFDFLLYLTGMSATSGNLAFDILGAGTATISKALYYNVGVDSSTPTVAAAPAGLLSATAQTAASIVTAATGTGLVVQGRGMFRVSAGGTIVPSVALVAASAAVMKDMSYFKCRRIGSASVVSQGDWS
ncbi:MAG: DUF2793 domain-containing protein [Aestuariivirga sp.]